MINLNNKQIKIKVNFNNLKSISTAEKIKTQLENKGYIQKSMRPYGYDKFILIYELDEFKEYIKIQNDLKKGNKINISLECLK